MRGRDLGCRERPPDLRQFLAERQIFSGIRRYKMRHKKQERNKTNDTNAIHIAIDLDGIRIEQRKNNRNKETAKRTQLQQQRRTTVDFHLHDEQERRKENPRLRHANPKDEERLGEFPTTAIAQKEFEGTIPKRAPYRKQEQHAQSNKNNCNDFAVQVQAPPAQSVELS